MRTSSILRVALIILSSGSNAFAQGAIADDEANPVASVPSAPSIQTTVEPATQRRSDVDRAIGLGAEIQFLQPTGYLAEFSGPQIGPVVRIGYRVSPPFELTIRSGFLYGTKKNIVREFDVGYSMLPVWAGSRYFLVEPDAALYVAAELGLNVLIPMAAGGTIPQSDKLQPRIGANVGIGYAISQKLPIDIRAQLTMYNLLLNSDVTNVSSGKAENPPVDFGLGLSAGYTFQL